MTDLLALALEAHRDVGLLGLDVAVAGEPNKGTMFAIYLPLTELFDIIGKLFNNLLAADHSIYH